MTSADSAPASRPERDVLTIKPGELSDTIRRPNVPPSDASRASCATARPAADRPQEVHAHDYHAV
jgi:hypothetical protein